MKACPPPVTRESGVALVVGLIVLTVLTLLAVTGMSTTQMEERMAGNYRDRTLAFQAAESALRDAEAFLQQANLPVFNGSQPGLINLVAGSGSTEYWTNFDWTNNSQQASTSLSDLNSQARYVIEELPAIPAATESQKFGALREQNVYKVTARATGGSGTAVVILQSTIQR